MTKRRDHDSNHIKVEHIEDKPEAQTVNELKEVIERLEKELEEQRKRTEEEHDSHLRALADFANYRRRHQDDYRQAIQFASRELILKILPVIDNFERALAASEQNHSFESLVEGVRLTLRQLEDILAGEGVKPIKAVGEQFDPMVHEAVMRVETDEYPENTIIEELQTGYMQNDHVIRPAKVKVAINPD